MAFNQVMIERLGEGPRNRKATGGRRNGYDDQAIGIVLGLLAFTAVGCGSSDGRQSSSRLSSGATTATTTVAVEDCGGVYVYLWGSRAETRPGSAACFTRAFVAGTPAKLEEGVDGMDTGNALDAVVVGKNHFTGTLISVFNSAITVLATFSCDVLPPMPFQPGDGAHYDTFFEQPGRWVAATCRRIEDVNTSPTSILFRP